MDIRVENLKMSYGKRQVLDIEHLTFSEGKSYGLVGHNGAGKTTLFKCITNIIATYDGDILIDEVTVKDDNKILLNVGIVLDGMSVYKERTGRFNIQYFSGLRGETNEAEAERIAKELDIADVLDEKVSTYSYGMQKKLILLIALLHNPKILILDEPFRGLDVKTVEWFQNYLKDLKKKGQTLLISSHIQSDLELLCEEIVVIDKGRVQEIIDLKEARKREDRLIDTSDNLRFLEIIHEIGLSFELNNENVLKINVADPLWLKVYGQLQEENITIQEMSRVKVLEEKLKEKRYDR